MSYFDMFAYTDYVNKILQEFPPNKILAFSVFCTETLFTRYSQYVKENVDEKQFNLLPRILNFSWSKVQDFDMEIEPQILLDSLEGCCDMILTLKVDHLSPLYYGANALIELSISITDICFSGSIEKAVICAEEVLESIEAELSKSDDVKLSYEERFRHIIMTTELNNQKKVTFIS